MSNNSKKRYVTIFPEWETVHLKKDVGMLPFSMGKYEDYDFKIVTYDKENLISADKDEYHIETVQKRKGDVLDFLKYIINNARQIDVLNLYHITSNRNAYWILFYKLCNPKGKVHIKLDADYRMIEVFNPHPKDLKGKIRINIFQHMVDLYTVETTEMLNKLTELWDIRMQLLPNGIYIDQKNDEDTLLKDENLFLTVGRLGTEQKATEILLEAYKNIANETSWNLLLVGPVEESFKDYIDKFYKENSHLTERVKFLGNISDESVLKNIYERSKVFVLPSRWESFGLVLLEALERGNYLVVSDQIPSISDISCDGKYCEVVPTDNPEALGKAMLAATRKQIDEEIRKERSEWIRDNFSWKSIVKQLHIYLGN